MSITYKLRPKSSNCTFQVNNQNKCFCYFLHYLVQQQETKRTSKSSLCNIKFYKKQAELSRFTLEIFLIFPKNFAKEIKVGALT